MGPPTPILEYWELDILINEIRVLTVQSTEDDWDEICC